MSGNENDQTLVKEAELDLRLAAAAARRAASKIERSTLPPALASKLDDFAEFLLEGAEQIRTHAAEQSAPCAAHKSHALGFARKVARRLHPGFSFERLQRD